MMRKVVGSIVCALVCVLGTVSPAGALALTPTDWQSRLVSVAPSTSAVRVEVFEGGEAIRVVAAPGHTVVVPGYANEPYLRIDAGGSVEENHNSPTWWSNRTTTGDAPVPDGLPTDPDWVRTGTDGTLTWHDHRIHAMPNVEGETDWTVTFAVDGLPVGARGRLVQLPGHNPAVEALVALLVAVATWFLGRRRARTIAPVAVVAAAAIAVVVAIGEVTAVPAGLDVPVLHLAVAIASLALALLGAALWRRPGRVGMVVTAGAIAVTAWWWALMLPAATAAIIPNSLADPIVRLGLAVVLGLLVSSTTLLVRDGGVVDDAQAVAASPA